VTTIPQTRYAKTEDGVHIAYQVGGGGPIDLVWVPGYVSHLESDWEEPRVARFLHRLSSFTRLIRFDKRGTGLSDRTGDQHLQQWVDDALAVMDAAGCERGAILGFSGGGPMAMMLAAAHPRRVSALLILASGARVVRSDDYPYGFTAEEAAATREVVVASWGTLASAPYAPSVQDDPAVTDWYMRRQRLAASPGAVDSVIRTLQSGDVRDVLPAIAVPALVMHCTRDQIVPVEFGRYLAEHIPGARYVELPGDDHLPYFEHADAILGEIEEFLTGSRPVPEAERVLATILFTDIVGSTSRNLELGDRRWRELLDRHESVAHREIERSRGRLVKSTGDGLLAVFDGPARAARCAAAIVDDAARLGIELRAGLHTGEIEWRVQDVAGVAVNIAERVCSHAGPGEVLVSRTVVDLVAGAGLEFADRGEQELKGVPGTWRLFGLALP
jgi:class 3 adenylate cyclase